MKGFNCGRDRVQSSQNSRPGMLPENLVMARLLRADLVSTYNNIAGSENNSKKDNKT